MDQVVIQYKQSLKLQGQIQFLRKTGYRKKDSRMRIKPQPRSLVCGRRGIRQTAE